MGILELYKMRISSSTIWNQRNYLFYDMLLKFFMLYYLLEFNNLYITSCLYLMQQNTDTPQLPTFVDSPTFQNNNLVPTNTKQPSQRRTQTKSMYKNQSQPKLKSFKDQVLKIPKVKQILSKDKYVYSQDIEKRLELIGTLKNENYIEEQKCTIDLLRKPVQSKSTTKLKSDKKTSKKNLKRHKTNFKIPLTRANMDELNKVIVAHIGHNQNYKNQQVLFLKQYAQNAPFDLQKLSFMDQIDKVKCRYRQKFPQLNQKVLSKNKLLLENAILNRNIRRQLKLDQKKQEKIHEKNVFNKINEKPASAKKKQSVKNQ